MSTAPCKYDWETQRCSCGGSGGRTESVEHHIRRERTYTSDNGEVWFYVDGKIVPATRESDVDLVYRTKTVWHGGVGLPMRVDDYPECPDCDGGEIEWAEAGRVPGSCECDTCGSRYVDTMFGHAAEVGA